MFDPWLEQCLPQGAERTPQQKAEFSAMLPNINLLYLGGSVLVLMFDETYMMRFWPQLEAWLSFMKGVQTGLVSTPEDELRCTIQCLGDAPPWYANSLKDRWLHCNATKAHRILSEPWVRVTNQSDKHVQLPKIWHLDYMARRHVRQRAAAQARADGGASANTLEGTGGGGGVKGVPETLAEKVTKIKKALELSDAIEMPTAIRQANEMLGLEASGPLPAQADVLIKALGV